MAGELDQKTQKLVLANSIFTPAAPINKKDLFAGRVEQINAVYGVINEKGRHAIMYGERGVGKTSLSNIINELLPESLVVKISCDTSDNFTSVWRKLLKRVSYSWEHQKFTGFGVEIKKESFAFNDLLPADKEILPDDVVMIFTKYQRFTILIVDEFDRVGDERTKKLFADIIKTISDSLPHITLILVGVANNVKELIGNHPSVERNLRQIRLPRMSSAELTEIIDKGLNTLQFNMNQRLKRHITNLSQGFPHYTHLLTKYCVSQTIESERTEILASDLKLAIEQAIEDTQESIREVYQKATFATKRAMFHEVLLACALAKEDEHSTFQARDLLEPFTRIAGRKAKFTDFVYHLGKLCSEERGFVLGKDGRLKRFRYHFNNPLLKPYIILRGISSGFLKDDFVMFDGLGEIKT